VVNVGLFNVDPTGNVVTKDDPNTTLGTLLKTSTEHRVIPDGTVPNSTNYPTVKDYLVAEAASGFLLKHMDQYVIVTEG
jgi:hypothetical protein